MHVISAIALVLLLGPLAAEAGSRTDDEPNHPATEPLAHIKRLALRVPDLERGIAFFRDVIGFRLDFEFTMEPGADPYFPLVFNIEHDKPVRMALFSTAKEPRGLFLAEFPDMVTPGANDPVDQAVVLEVPDLTAVQERARNAGFETAEPQEGTAPDGTGFSEMLIVGPGGQRVLVFQYLSGEFVH